MLTKLNKNGEIEIHVFILNSERILGRTFFSTNTIDRDGTSCFKCGKTHLGRFERVDCEFWPGTIDSYCLDCWAETTPNRKHSDVAQW